MKTIETIIGLFFLAVVMVIAHGQVPLAKAPVASGADKEPSPALLPEVRTEVEKRF